MSYFNDSPERCKIEVDFEYPKELHNLHKDYHLAPNKAEIKNGALSDYCETIMDMHNVSVGNVKNLVPNLFDKERCILHYKNL